MIQRRGAPLKGTCKLLKKPHKPSSKRRHNQTLNSRRIVDTRNRIIHGYDTVSDEIIWGILIQYLPNIKTEIEQLLSK